MIGRGSPAKLTLTVEAAEVRVPRAQPASPLALLELTARDGSIGRAVIPFVDAAVRELGRRSRWLAGCDAFAAADRWRAYLAHPQRDRHGPTWLAFAAIENAAADLCAQSLGVPLHELLGGVARDRVPVALVLSVPDSRHSDAGRGVDRVLDRARRVMASRGFDRITVEGRGGAWRDAVTLVAALRESFGTGLRLRLRFATALPRAERGPCLRAAAALRLEYVQDDAPLHQRNDFATPRCGHRVVRTPVGLAASVRRGVCQVVGVAPTEWGGVRGIVQLAAVCQVFHVELGLWCREDTADLAIAAHIGAALPAATIGIEVDDHPRDSRDDSSPPLWDHASVPAVHDGAVRPAAQPGTGLEIHPHAWQLLPTSGRRARERQPPTPTATTPTRPLRPPRPLRVVGASIRRVRIPVAPVYVSSMYIMDSTTRTIVELQTEDGIVGLGEAPGADEVFHLVTRFATDTLGADLRARRALQQHFARTVFDNRNGRHGWSAQAAIELAAWDATAQAYGIPLSTLLGAPECTAPEGRWIDVGCPVPAAIVEGTIPRAELQAHMADLGNAGRVAAYASAQAHIRGFRTFKYKSAAASVEWDVAVMEALRAELGPEPRIRFDPNAGYSPVEAMALCRRLESIGIEFWEDPTDDLEGLAAVRARTRTPVATNMSVTQLDHLAPAVHRDAIDVILADVFTWGGPLHFLTLAATADVLGLELGIHSLFETGIGTAFNLHMAAALPQIHRANDAGLHAMGDDLTTGADLDVRDGRMRVPSGPGLGVRLDTVAVRHFGIDEAHVTL